MTNRQFCFNILTSGNSTKRALRQTETGRATCPHCTAPACGTLLVTTIMRLGNIFMFAYLELQEKQIPSASQFTSLSLVRPSPYLRVAYFSKKRNIEHCSARFIALCATYCIPMKFPSSSLTGHTDRRP